MTLEPGTAYQHNWHLDHLAWQLRARGARRGEAADHLRAAALDEVDHRLGGLHRLGAGALIRPAHHLRVLCR